MEALITSLSRDKDEDKAKHVELSGYVGFDSLPDRVSSKAVQKGFVFNILCIGETGIGKSTLMDSLFSTKFEDATPKSHDLLSIKLNSQTYELQERNVQMDLTITHTVGFGDQINRGESCKAILDYVDDQFEAYLREELKIERCLQSYHDTRVHVCLYFICPTGHGLKSIDLECMKKLDKKVNIVPLIAKSDTISAKDLLKFKENIASELKANGIKIYQCPTDDESVREVNIAMNNLMPFAVVGSTDFVKVGTRTARAREYPWGVVEIENDNHCDFVKLREMLIRTNMEDLKETTHDNHYELYRKKRLDQMGLNDLDAENKPITFQQSWQRKLHQHQSKLEQREEEVRNNFIRKTKDKDEELKEAERQVLVKHDEFKREINMEKLTYDEYLNQLEKDIAEFQRLKLEYSTGRLTGSHRHTLSLGTLKRKKDKKLLSISSLN